MLRLDLTDGDATVVAVEYRELTSVEDASALAPGTKVAVPPGVRIRCQSGILLAHGDALRVLGGKVAALAEEWEQRSGNVRAVAETGDAVAGTNAPRFETYEREKAEATVAAAIAGRTAANRAVAEAIAEKRAASASTNFNRKPRAGNGAGEEPAPFVPRRRPALPPTRARASRRSGRGVSSASALRCPPPPRRRRPDGPWSPGRARGVARAELHRTRSQEAVPKEVKEAIPSPPPGFRARAARPKRRRRRRSIRRPLPLRVCADRHRGGQAKSPPEPVCLGQQGRTRISGQRPRGPRQGRSRSRQGRSRPWARRTRRAEGR